MIEAVKIAETSLESVLGNIRPGVTEKQFAADLVIELLRNGSDSELPFSPIVASGINAANPHHFPGNKEFQDGELIIIDWGANFEGYFSDITRTFALGDNIDSELLRAYKTVRQANRAARIKANIGVKAGNVDQAAREVIETSGFGKYFTHRTGHGLGLEVHEEPYIKPGNDFILEKGMTFTIEPGIYIPNLGGIRIEDDIFLEDSGATSLTTLSRELINI
ncbi:MAG: M24 family metallopeptidase, partial [Candidatus Poseidoniales archaeon]